LRKIARNVLMALVCLEVAVAAVLVGQRLARRPVPLLDLRRLDSATARDLEALRQQVDSDSTTLPTFAEACLAYGYFPAAEVCLKEAAAEFPESPELTYAWAICLERLGRIEEAIERLDQLSANALRPDLAQIARYHSGRCWLRLENPAKAEAAFRSVPHVAAAHYQLAKLLFRTGRVSEARTHLDAIQAEYGNDLRVLQLVDQVESEVGNNNAASLARRRLESAQALLNLDPNQQFLERARERYGLARQRREYDSLDRAGRVAEAAAVVREVLQTNEGWENRIPMLTVRGIELSLKSGQAEQALQLLEEQFARGPITPWMLELQGGALSALQRYEEAWQVWQRVVAMRPNADLHTNLANYYRAVGKPEEAKTQQALAFHEQGVEFYRSGRFEDAKGAFDQALSLKPELANTWYYVGELRTMSGDSQAARQAYERCLEIDSAHGRAAAALQEFSTEPRSV